MNAALKNTVRNASNNATHEKAEREILADTNALIAKVGRFRDAMKKDGAWGFAVDMNLVEKYLKQITEFLKG